MTTQRLAPDGRKIVTDCWRKSIPTAAFDWSATLDDYDGAEDSSTRHLVGCGPTEEAAITDLLEKIEERS